MKAEMKLLIALAALGGPAVLAKETSIDAGSVPTAVRQAIASRFPGAKVKRYSKDVEKGKVEYEALLEVGHQAQEVSFGEDGTVLSQELRIRASDLPAAAQASLQGLQPIRVEKLLERGETRYEVLVVEKGSRRELVFDQRGARVEPNDDDRGTKGGGLNEH